MTIRLTAKEKAAWKRKGIVTERWPRRLRCGLAFDQQCRLACLPIPVAEHRFHATRKWRFDWAFLEAKVAVESEGGVWTNGRHTRGSGFLRDVEKYNTATIEGWRVLRVTPDQIDNGTALALVDRILRKQVA